MQQFRTYYIISRKNKELIESLRFPKNKLILKVEPTQRFWESEDGKGFTQFTNHRHKKNNDLLPQYELVLEADNFEEAEDLLSKIHGGMLLTYPDPGLACQNIHIGEIDKIDESIFRDDSLGGAFNHFQDVAFGCKIASLISNDKSLAYAIEKYKVSLELFSISPYFASPTYGQYFESYESKTQIHTKSAFAIIAAFSVIEELGLEIRSSSKKPRFEEASTGEWNEAVLADIVERLEKNNISSNIDFDWIYRGQPSQIEEKMKPNFGKESIWVKYGNEIRDKTLTLPEAIHFSSYLRNFIAAHKFNELTQFINSYDVFNVQSLSRLLILRKLGLWEEMKNRFK